MNLDDIQILIKALEESSLVELVWELDDAKLVLKKAAAYATASPPGVAAGGMEAVAMEPLPASGTDDGLSGRVTIEAPMVGTFYRAPAPDAAPYVRVGDIVEVGQPLCIIEAMKLMNEIESEVRGKVLEILADNAQPVEYGQPLFVIEQI